MRLSIATAVSFLLLSAAAAPAAAQEPTRSLRLWAAGGLGSGGSAAGDGLVGLLQLSAQKEPQQFSVRVLGIADPFDGAAPAVNEFALLYGRTAISGFGHIAASGGIGLTSVNDCAGQLECSARVRPGIALGVEAAIQSLPIAGLGLTLFGDVNSEASLVGLALFLYLGWLPR